MKLSLSKFSVCLSVLRMENSSPSGSSKKRFKFSQFDVSTDKKQFLKILLLSLVHLYKNLHFLEEKPSSAVSVEFTF